jgi:hypothetical protein
MAHPLFNSTHEEAELIRNIVSRAQELGMTNDRLGSIMDIDACNSNGTPLNLKQFLAFDDFNFAHDFIGIQNHIDRRTGELQHCFLPRCHKPEEDK